MNRYLIAIALTALLFCCGCDDHAGAGGLVIDAPRPAVQRGAAAVGNQRPDQDDPAANDRGRPGRNGWGRDRELPSDSADWGDDREMPGDQLPSQRQVTGRDRDMPSDSMPSRTGKWGKDREMPSDSPNWGKGRQMPSDTAFRSRSDDDSDSKPASEDPPARDTADEPSDE